MIQGIFTLCSASALIKGTPSAPAGIVVGPNAMMGVSTAFTDDGLVKIFCPNKYVGYFNVTYSEAVVVPVYNPITGAMTEFCQFRWMSLSDLV